MSHYQAEDAEYMADEYEKGDVDDDMDDELRGRDNGGSDSDVDEYDDMKCKITNKGGSYYEFRRNSRSVRSTIHHFQSREWATRINVMSTYESLLKHGLTYY